MKTSIEVGDFPAMLGDYHYKEDAFNQDAKANYVDKELAWQVWARGWFPTWRYHQIIHIFHRFSMMFQDIPSMLGYPFFMEIPTSLGLV